MSELDHSKRSLERATYSPLKTSGRDVAGGNRAWDKWSYAASLSPSRQESARVVDRLQRGPRPVPREQRAALKQLAALFDRQPETPSASLPLEVAPVFAGIPAGLLQRFGEELLEVRQADLNEVVATQQTIFEAYQKVIQPGAAPEPTPAKPAPGLNFDPDFVRPDLPGAQLYRSELREISLKEAPSPEVNLAARVKPAPESVGAAFQREAQLVLPVSPPMAAALAAEPPNLGALAAWANANRFQRARADRALNLASSWIIGASKMRLSEFRAVALSALNVLRDLNYYFGQRMQVEPVGLLHLERVTYTPAGIERGELIHSVPLSPGEEVNISHKEWSNTSEEFERIVTDYLEAYSEEGVTEKSELSQSSNSQIQHSSGFNLGVTASGGYGPVSISTTVGYNVADSASRTEATARNHTSEMTRKASSRVKKEHKISFKVASASGTEDQAVRRIKNPFTNRVTRIDYYQLVRKWRVDLYRYGVRLTYDLTIPEPGADILSKILEIRSLTAALQEGFASPTATLSWARFDLAPQQVTRSNYQTLAAQYGVAVEPPPVDSFAIVRSFSHQWENKDQAKKDEYISFDVEVPDDYQVSAYSYSWQRWAWTDESWHFDIRTDLDQWLGVGGRLTLTIGTRYVSAFQIQIRLTLALKDSAFKAWQMRVWGVLHDAAQARYELNRTMLKDRLARLQEELGAQDALSLRKVEREEVMKGMLRWMFGPSFTFVPPGLPANLYGSDQSVISNTVWAKVLAQGEVIKFLHQAIEWENMLYFLYPYFWSHTSRWEFKKYLDHPDFMHRTFLKAGSARVVLTIRPGFETDFVSFLETGTFNPLPANHPYMTIAQEMEAYARTNYPGIRAANPEEGARPLLTPPQKRAWKEMQAIIALIEQYRQLNGAYPTTAQGLAALAGLGTVPAADPWGTPYQYRSPGAFTDFELISFGSDGKEGGADEAADITSWADASLIGRWYDYTPTSALDIAFDELLPGA